MDGVEALVHEVKEGRVPPQKYHKKRTYPGQMFEKKRKRTQF